MTGLLFIFRSFIHYFKANVLLFFGIAITTAVLTGSLIIGDSMRYSLHQSVSFRLGKTTHTISSFDRYFSQGIAQSMEKMDPRLAVAPVLILKGSAVAEGGARRVNQVQAIGVDSAFRKIAGTVIFSSLGEDEVVISKNLSQLLEIEKGGRIMIRLEKASLVPLNTPFVSDDETSVSFSAIVKEVAGAEQLGNFNLKNSQTAPYNLFLPLSKLNQLMEFSGKANYLLISAGNQDDREIQEIFNAAFKPDDAGLIMKEVRATGEINLSSDRIFLDPVIVEAYKQIENARPVLTYFVNSIRSGDRETPYSFVSALSSGPVDDEIWINKWLADDLKAKPGDSILLSYFEIGPLRELETREARFRVTKILPMDGELADSLLMPSLPGMSDAGHCREWKAGIPIDLKKIRDEDEDYWNQWRGTPKAFISDALAQKIWSNRFGSYTAIRIPALEIHSEGLETYFSDHIKPEDLGFLLNPVKEQGIYAADKGTDFSQLFIGLGFFVIVASLILSSLLFRLTIETRIQQIGTQLILGFRKSQLIRYFLLESSLSTILGGLIGVILALFYTRLVFMALNSLWFDIVRSDVMLLKINPGTLLTGFLVSFLFSLATITLALRRFMTSIISKLQRQTPVMISKKKVKTTLVSSTGLLLAAFILLIWQIFFSDQLNSGMFFLMGTLFLAGLLVLTNVLILKNQVKTGTSLSENTLSVRNLSRNRSRSLSVIILFAIGTFLVISTGSNRRDLFSGANDQKSGTGGFLYYAETSVPVLYNLNDPVRRAQENVEGNYQVIQFFKVEGDDASCLNLNRISQPAILGVNPGSLSGRFSFSALLKDWKGNDPWSMLNGKNPDGTVNAIADQTVIQWGMGKKVGDTLIYRNGKGDKLIIRLVAGLNASIFQGNILISDSSFLKNFPTSSGSTVFLIDGDPNRMEAISDELRSAYRDYGWEMQYTAQRLAEFNSVTNTYLSIFMALGALGLILGTAGLAVILARTILERRREIALMQAIGFRNSTTRKVLVAEYTLLFLAGLIAGLLTAILAVLPSFLSSGTGSSLLMVVALAVAIFLSGFLLISALAGMATRKKVLNEALKNE